MSDGGYQSFDQTLAKPQSISTTAPSDQTINEAEQTGASAAPADGSQILIRLIEKLPLAEREAVTLFFFDRWPLERVAGTMQRTPEQVAGLLLSAAKTLYVQPETLKGGEMP